MDTEMIIYRPTLIQNGKFSVIADYGWQINPTSTSTDYPWIKVDGSISKVANVSGGFITQLNVMKNHAKYRLRFTITNRTAGILRVRKDLFFPATPDYITVSGNAMYDITITATGKDLYFQAANTFDGTISNVILNELPETYSLDLYDDVSIPLTFNIDSIIEIGKLKTTHSKSIKLPGTENNNKAFNHIYKINSESSFNPNLKCKVLIKNQGLLFFEGILCLDDITKTISNGVEDIEYNISVYGEVLTIFDKLADKTIRDLDFSYYDHEFTEERISATWMNDIKINGLASNNNRNLTYASPNILTMNVVSFTDNIVNYNTGSYIEIQFISAHSFNIGDDIYLDTNVYQIFGDTKVIGITASDKIIVPIAKYWVGTTPTLVGNVYIYDYLGIGPWYPMVDYGKYETVASSPLVVGRAYYIGRAVFPEDFTAYGAPNNNGKTWFIATGAYNFSQSLLYQLDTRMETLSTHERFINHWVPTDFVPHIFVYEVMVKMLAMLGYNYECPLFDSQFFRRLVIPVDTKFNLNDVKTNGQLTIGQEYMILSYVSGDNFANVGATSNSTGNIFRATGANPTNWTHSSKLAMMVNLNQWTPSLKLKDFFISILNMFNLCILEDPERKRILHIQNRGEFFRNGIVDWSDKLSSSEQIRLTLSNSILPTYYQFKYKDSTDFYNTDYNQDFGDANSIYGDPKNIDRKYGDIVIRNIADFAKDPKILQLSFEPTILAGPIQPVVSLGKLISSGIYADSDKTLSTCFYMDDSGNLKRNNPNRIHIISIRSCLTQWSLNSEGTPSNDISDVRAGNYGIRFYPFAGHTDDRNSYSILFGKPLANYTPLNTPSQKTLYNKYWVRYISDINNVNAKIIECVLRLTIKDIAELDFSKLYRINDFVMKLNKITDWNIYNDGLCKVEFLLKNI